MSALNSAVGLCIRLAREERGLTQGELAKRLDPPRSHAAVSDIERGITQINLDTLGQIAFALDKDIGYFLGYAGQHRHRWVCADCREPMPTVRPWRAR